MSFTMNDRRSLRGGSGLAITTAVHLVLGYVALTVTGIVDVPFKPNNELIEIDNIPDKPREKLLPPIDRLDKVDVTIVDPEIEIEQTPLETIVRDIVVQSDSSGLQPGTGGTTTVLPPHAPPFIGPRLDERFLSRFQPPYPSVSQRVGEQGAVAVSVVVGVNGRVLFAEISESSGYARLDQAATEQALTRWRFLPATRGGVAVESRYRVTVRFVLKE